MDDNLLLSRIPSPGADDAERRRFDRARSSLAESIKVFQSQAQALYQEEDADRADAEVLRRYREAARDGSGTDFFNYNADLERQARAIAYRRIIEERGLAGKLNEFERTQRL